MSYARQSFCETGFMPDVVPAKGRHYDAFGVGAAVQGASSIASAAIQANAAKHAADLQSQATKDSLDFSKNVWNTQQTNAAPWLEAGKGALGTLATGLGDGGQFTKGFDPTAAGLTSKFQAPDAFKWDPSSVQNDPAYQFRLQQGTQALQRSAAAKGSVLGGGTLKALADYTSGTAAQYENQDYNQAAGTYQQNYSNAQNAYQQNYSNAFNTFNTNQGNLYNRLSSLAGMGQTANGQLSGAGSAAASNYGSIALNGANAAGNFGTQGASAAGAGILGAGNALANYGLYKQVYGSGSGGGAPDPNNPPFNPNWDYQNGGYEV